MTEPSLREMVQPGISRRSDFPLRASSMALLVIDIQRELTVVDEGSKDYKKSISFPRMIANTKRLIDAVRCNRSRRDDVGGRGSEIIFTYLEAHTDDSRDVSLDYKLSGGLSSLPGPSSPAEFLPGISPVLGEDVALPKTSCSVFQSTNLDYILRNLHVEQLVVCGQLTDQCVESAVRDAADLGYLVSVVEDACAAESVDSHQKGLHGMKGFSRRVQTEQVLRELSASSSISSVVDSKTLPSTREEARKESSALDPRCCVTSIPKTTEYRPRNEEGGCQTALLRSLRAAGVKFLRFTVIDAFNTIRCKMVPLATLLPGRGHGTRPSSLPFASPTSIAEVCFAGLPTHADVPVAASNLTARNVLTLRPDLSSLRILPYAPTVAMVMCTAHNQRTRELSPLCTRGLLERVLQEARAGMGIEFCVGAELEFQLFLSGTKDGVPQPVDATTFANALTLNEQGDFISDLYEQLSEQDIPVELVHSESAPGQLEVVLKYSDPLRLADNVVLARETISACAKKHGTKALFLPKTSMMTAGNGLHLHFSFRDSGSSGNSFADPTQPTGISDRGQSFMEGVLKHLPSLLSFSMPTLNSFRRMGPGCWTGSAVGWSIEDKEVPIRLCVDLNTCQVTNVEYKLADAMANVYLELAVILAAGMNSMKNGSELRPIVTDTTSNPLPNGLQESLDLLKKDPLLLGVLGPELSAAYIAVRESEAMAEKTLEAELAYAFNRL